MNKNITYTFFLFILLLCTNNTRAQQVYELKLSDCDQEEDNFPLRLTVNILTAHKIISEFGDLIVFKTTTDRIKISYKNLYDQQMDTVFIPKKNRQKEQFQLCLDTFKDNIKETCIEHAIAKRKRWKFRIISEGCSGRFESKIVIIPKKDKTIAKYVTTEYVSELKRYKKVIQYRILTETQLKAVIRFEKKLRLHGAAVKATYGDTIKGLYLYTYTIQSGSMETEIKSSLTLKVIDERYLLDKLGFAK
ncbi:MAG: hypothetical protein AB8B65_11290 [Kordia sp.]|uniref:hypothetical protein n=1 Tax=Kordia sp. TaxID=1965332 RepID=UPI00385FFD14